MKDQRWRALQKTTFPLSGLTLQHGHQLVVGVAGRQLQVGDQPVHLGEDDCQREAVSERLTDAALRVQHDAFDRVDADQRTVADAET